VVDRLPEEELGRFGPYAITELTHGVQAVFKARSDYYGPKPPMRRWCTRRCRSRRSALPFSRVAAPTSPVPAPA